MNKNCICPLRRASVLLVALIMLSAVCPAQAGRKTGSSEWKKKVTVVEWFHGGRSVLRKGHCGYVYDIKSGKTIRVKRLGGHNHMDLEPADRASGAVMKKLGKSWKPRPAILYANGRFIACSINTMPHGKQTIKNNGFDGQFCLHMAGSKTHGGDVVRGDHQSAVEKAYKWAHR